MEQLKPFGSAGKCPKCGGEERDLQWCEATASGPEMLRVCCADCFYRFPDELPLDATHEKPADILPTCGECVSFLFCNDVRHKFLATHPACNHFEAKPAAPQQPELKPCPFCGCVGTLEQDKDVLTWPPVWKVLCLNADCETGPDTGWHDTADQAIAAWNRRTP